MISFIDKQLDKDNFKVWLHSPGGEFLGELIVDKPVLNLELEGLVSTFTFSIPENLDIVDASQLTSIVNPRLNETLDQFQVEVWYGDLKTEAYQKQRFIIIDRPNSFSNDITQFNYKAYSREYETKFIRMIDWPGILVREYVDARNFSASSTLDTNVTFTLARTPKDERLVRAELVKDFVYRLVNKTVSEVPYQFSTQPKLSTIKIYKKNGGSWTLLIKDTDYKINTDAYTGVYSIEYILNAGSNVVLDDITYVEYKLDQPLTFGLVRNDTATLNSEYDFYYNEATNQFKCFIPDIPQVFSKESVLSYDPVLPADSALTVKIYYESVQAINPNADPFFDNLTTDGLTIQQLLASILAYGDEDNNSAKWTAQYASTIGNTLRSGFKFNNTTVFIALNEVLKSFDAIAIPDTINKTFYIYNKNQPDSFVNNNVVVSSYRQPTGLSIEYGKYLQNVQESISTEDIVTIIRGLGANNITADSATPTGYNEWEDYTYFLDGVFITNWDAMLANPNTGLTPALSASGRWMSDQLTTKLLLWQFARTSIENILYETLPSNLTGQLGGYIQEGGIITAQDAIFDLIVLNEKKIIPLRVEKAKSDTLLTTLEIAENIEHLFNWTGSFEGVSYSGTTGYENYVKAKQAKVDTEINSIEIVLNQLQKDFDSINALLQTFYIAIKKQNFIGLFNNTDLTSYNFNTQDFQELAGFRREGVYENKFIAKASDLFQAMKEEINALKQPRVEVSANIIGLLQTTETRSEWNNLVLGGLANIIVPRLNIDLQIQLKSLTISPDANSTNIKFSTEKNYIGIGQKYLGRLFSNAAYNLKNNLGYNEGFWTQGSVEGLDASNKLAEGFLIGGDNPLTTQTVIVDNNGITTNGHTVNPIDDTVVSATSDIGRMLLFGFVKINAGRIDVYNRNVFGETINKVVISPTGFVQDTALSQVVMDVNGFAINKKDNGNLIPQFFVDQNGNIVFAGTISQTVKDALFIDFNTTPVDITSDSFVFKYEDPLGTPSPESITLTANLRADFAGFFWEYDSGNDTWVSLNTTTQTFVVNHNAGFWGSKEAIRFRCTSINVNDATITDFDIVTIVKLFNGPAGADGVDGVDALTVILTNESHTLPRTNTNVITYTGSGTDILLFEGTTQLIYNASGTTNGTWAVSASGSNITPGSINPVSNLARVGNHNNMTNTFASVTYSITGKRLDGTSLSLTKTQSLAVAQEGQNGGKGDQGDRGPGVTFRGLFSTGEFYVNDGDIRDVVEHPADSQAYYAVAVGTGSSGSSGTSLGTPSTINSNWLKFNQYAAVATDILLADNATIKKTLIMGDATGNVGIIRNNSATSKANIISGAQTGFFLDGADGSLTANSCRFLSGQIGAATFGSTTLGGSGALEVSRMVVTSSAQIGNLGLVVQGNISSNNIFPRFDNQYDLGESFFIAGVDNSRYWKRIYLRNSPIVSSDENKKENIAPVGNEYNNIILNTEIITYNNIGDDKPKIGIGARQFYSQFGEESQLILPFTEEGIFSADYVAFVPMMIKTIQEQEKRIQALEEQLNNV